MKCFFCFGVITFSSPIEELIAAEKHVYLAVVGKEILLLYNRCKKRRDGGKKWRKSWLLWWWKRRPKWLSATLPADPRDLLNLIFNKIILPFVKMKDPRSNTVNKRKIIIYFIYFYSKRATGCYEGINALLHIINLIS